MELYDTKLSLGDTSLFTPNVSVDISQISITDIFIELMDKKNANKLINLLVKEQLVPTNIEDCVKYDDRNRYIINFIDDKKRLYMSYNPIKNDLKYGLYTSMDLVIDSQYDQCGLYGQCHPSGYRLYGYDDESISFVNDETGKYCLCLQDEKELYDKVINICIKYFNENKERIEKERLLHD